MPELKRKTLSARAGSAGIWVLASHGSSQILRLASSVILTRLLAPEAYALMAVVWVILTGMTLFSDMGISHQLVQSKRGDDQRFVNTAWTIQVIRGFGISILCLLGGLALYVVRGSGILDRDLIYAHQDLSKILAVMSVLPIITGLESTKAITALRNLDQGRLAVIEVTTLMITTLASLVWAISDASVWALVFGSIVGGIIRCLLTHLYLPGFKNRLFLCRESVSEVLTFGVWAFLSTIATFFVSNGDRILLSYFLEASDFGIYAVAYNIYTAFRSVVTTLLAKVGYPVLSEKLKRDPDTAPSLFFKIGIGSDVLILALSGFLYVVSADVIGLLYDSRYSGAGIYLSILSIGLVAEKFSLTEFYLLALGLPKYLFQANMIRLISIYSLVPIAFVVYGPDALVWGVALSGFVVSPYIFILASRHGIFKISKEFVAAPAFIVGLGLGVGFHSAFSFLKSNWGSLV